MGVIPLQSTDQAIVLSADHSGLTNHHKLSVARVSSIALWAAASGGSRYDLQEAQNCVFFPFLRWHCL